MIPFVFQTISQTSLSVTEKRPVSRMPFNTPTKRHRWSLLFLLSIHFSLIFATKEEGDLGKANEPTTVADSLVAPTQVANPAAPQGRVLERRGLDVDDDSEPSPPEELYCDPASVLQLDSVYLDELVRESDQRLKIGVNFKEKGQEKQKNVWTLDVPIDAALKVGLIKEAAKTGEQNPLQEDIYEIQKSKKEIPHQINAKYVYENGEAAIVDHGRKMVKVNVDDHFGNSPMDSLTMDDIIRCSFHNGEPDFLDVQQRMSDMLEWIDQQHKEKARSKEFSPDVKSALAALNDMAEEGIPKNKQDPYGINSDPNTFALKYRTITRAYLRLRKADDSHLKVRIFSPQNRFLAIGLEELEWRLKSLEYNLHLKEVEEQKAKEPESDKEKRSLQKTRATIADHKLRIENLGNIIKEFSKTKHAVMSNVRAVKHGISELEANVKAMSEVWGKKFGTSGPQQNDLDDKHKAEKRPTTAAAVSGAKIYSNALTKLVLRGLSGISKYSTTIPDPSMSQKLTSNKQWSSWLKTTWANYDDADATRSVLEAEKLGIYPPDIPLKEYSAGMVAMFFQHIETDRSMQAWQEWHDDMQHERRRSTVIPLVEEYMELPLLFANIEKGPNTAAASARAALESWWKDIKDPWETVGRDKQWIKHNPISMLIEAMRCKYKWPWFKPLGVAIRERRVVLEPPRTGPAPTAPQHCKVRSWEDRGYPWWLVFRDARWAGSQHLYAVLRTIADSMRITHLAHVRDMRAIEPQDRIRASCKDIGKTVGNPTVLDLDGLIDQSPWIWNEKHKRFAWAVPAAAPGAPAIEYNTDDWTFWGLISCSFFPQYSRRILDRIWDRIVVATQQIANFMQETEFLDEIDVEKYQLSRELERGGEWAVPPTTEMGQASPDRLVLLYKKMLNGLFELRRGNLRNRGGLLLPHIFKYIQLGLREVTDRKQQKIRRKTETKPRLKELKEFSAKAVERYDEFVDKMKIVWYAVKTMRISFYAEFGKLVKARLWERHEGVNTRMARGTSFRPMPLETNKEWNTWLDMMWRRFDHSQRRMHSHKAFNKLVDKTETTILVASPSTPDFWYVGGMLLSFARAVGIPMVVKHFEWEAENDRDPYELTDRRTYARDRDAIGFEIPVTGRAYKVLLELRCYYAWQTAQNPHLCANGPGTAPRFWEKAKPGYNNKGKTIMRKLEAFYGRADVDPWDPDRVLEGHVSATRDSENAFSKLREEVHEIEDEAEKADRLTEALSARNRQRLEDLEKQNSERLLHQTSNLHRAEKWADRSRSEIKSADS